MAYGFGGKRVAFALRQVSLFVMKNIRLTSVLRRHGSCPSGPRYGARSGALSRPGRVTFLWAKELPFCALLLGSMLLAWLA